jgi:hypothetical protein
MNKIICNISKPTKRRIKDKTKQINKIEIIDKKLIQVQRATEDEKLIVEL